MADSLSFLNINVHTDRRCLARVASFGFETGKITFLLGESGIGKSLLSKVYMGIMPPGRLNIEVNGKPYDHHLAQARRSSRLRDGFFVFQEPSSHFNPMRTIGRQLSEGQLGRLGRGAENTILRAFWPDKNIAESLLNVYPKPYRPSGGEKQRLLLAMAFKKIALYQKKKSAGDALFIFDEPSGSLDNAARNRFLDELITRYRQKPFTAVVITHDYTIVSHLSRHYAGLADEVAWMELLRDTEEGSLLLKPFPHHSFEAWLASLAPVRSQLDHSGLEILRLKSGMSIWKRRFAFLDARGREVDFTLKRGEATYIKAASGVGKTTVAKVIMGLLTAEQAVLTILNRPVPETGKRAYYARHIWGKQATMVFQHADEALNGELTVEEVFKVLSSKRTVNRQKIMRRLREWFGDRIPDSFLHRPVKYLSGGQKQRLNLLRGFVQNTDILILDEPLNGLDLKSADLVIKKIQERQRDGKAILIISHNEDIMEKIIPGENIFYLEAGSGASKKDGGSVPSLHARP